MDFMRLKKQKNFERKKNVFQAFSIECFKLEVFTMSLLTIYFYNCIVPIWLLIKGKP